VLGGSFWASSSFFVATAAPAPVDPYPFCPSLASRVPASRHSSILSTLSVHANIVCWREIEAPLHVAGDKIILRDLENWKQPVPILNRKLQVQI
jgi:hypothetical protein